MPAISPRLRLLGSDQRLVGLVRDGQEGAFEALYDRHHRAILSFCRHMLGDAYEAEDAVQHTFMAAYRELAYTTKEINVRPWLFTIARNRCYSILRARREQPTDEFDQLTTEGLASEVQRREDLRDLLSDMAELPSEQRAALVLSELDALSHAEIGDVLGVRADKVKALVYQARSSLLASKNARETPCEEIREELSTGRGAALRRANLRRHLRECDGCREFRSEVERQRRQLRALMPVVPSLALKELALGAAVVGGGGAAATAGGGALLSGALKGGILKATLGVLAVSAGTAGTAIIVATGGLPVGSVLGHSGQGMDTRMQTSRAHGQTVSQSGAGGSQALASRIHSAGTLGASSAQHAGSPMLTLIAGKSSSAGHSQALTYTAGVPPLAPTVQTSGLPPLAPGTASASATTPVVGVSASAGASSAAAVLTPTSVVSVSGAATVDPTSSSSSSSSSGTGTPGSNGGGSGSGTAVVTTTTTVTKTITTTSTITTPGKTTTTVTTTPAKTTTTPVTTTTTSGATAKSSSATTTTTTPAKTTTTTATTPAKTTTTATTPAKTTTTATTPAKTTTTATTPAKTTTTATTPAKTTTTATATTPAKTTTTATTPAKTTTTATPAKTTTTAVTTTPKTSTTATTAATTTTAKATTTVATTTTPAKAATTTTAKPAVATTTITVYTPLLTGSGRSSSGPLGR